MATVASLMPFTGLHHAIYGRLLRLALGLSGLLNLSILAGSLMATYFLLNADAERYFLPVPMRGWLAIAPVISIVLTAAMFYLGRKAGWSSQAAGLYNFILLINSEFILFMGHWGLIGSSL